MLCPEDRRPLPGGAVHFLSPVPPGPPSLPIIGSLPFITTRHGFADFTIDSNVRLMVTDGIEVIIAKKISQTFR